MADPVSLAGTAIGVLSLGIQVCQELRNYVNSASSRDKNIATILEQTTTLISIFDALRTVLPSVLSAVDASRTATGPGAMLAALELCVEQVQGKISEVHTMLSSLREPQVTTAQAKIRDVGKRLLYPLRRADTQELQKQLDGLVSNAQLAFSLVIVYDPPASLAQSQPIAYLKALT